MTRRIDTTKLRALIGEGAAIAPTYVRVRDQLEREHGRVVNAAIAKLERVPADGGTRDAQADRLMRRLEDSDYQSDLAENPRQSGAAAFIKLIGEIDAL